MSSYSRSWINERLRIQVTLPRPNHDYAGDVVLFIHPKVVVHEEVSSSNTSLLPPEFQHNGAGVVVMDDVLTAPLRVPDADMPLLMLDDDTNSYGSGMFNVGCDTTTTTEVGSLIRNLIIHKLSMYSRRKTFTFSADPSVRLVAMITAIAVSRRCIDTTPASTVSHLIEPPLSVGYETQEHQRRSKKSPFPSTKSSEVEFTTTATTEAADEMLRVLEPLWAFKGNMKEATFRHSKSQQVPVTEAFLKKLGFAAGSFTLVNTTTTTTSSSSESQVGVQSSPSSQCGESVSDFDDDEDDFIEQHCDVEVLHHRHEGGAQYHAPTITPASHLTINTTFHM